MNIEPKVSIITPTYNCGRFISETINSVIAQTYPHWEMLIVDDCSYDSTKHIVEQFVSKDSRIKYYCLEKNSGAAVARNLALKKAKGKWIAFLDSDDLWHPAKLEKQIEFMETNDYAFSYHEYHEIAESGKDLNVYVGGKKKVGIFDMFACCWPGCLAVMYDREKIGLIQIADIKKNNDTALWLKVIRKSKCYLLNEDLAAYRRRKGGITPPTVFQKIWAQYPLFRIGEGMNPVSACFWTIMNVFGNTYKKLFYTRKL
ncbi:MAG: glycosyltransferase [Muribaculaceae bacterium]|nr:glycosyltransferase [Muribaculaceae bacterium]